MATRRATVTTALLAVALVAIALLAAGPQLAHLEVARCLPATGSGSGCAGGAVVTAPGSPSRTGSESTGSCLRDASCGGAATSALTALAAGLGAAVVVATAVVGVARTARRAARRRRAADPGRHAAGGLFRPPRLLPA